MSQRTSPTQVFLEAPGKPREHVRLGPAFNSGAAGTVHAIVGDATRVVKLYNPETLQKEGKSYEAKVRAMIGHAPHLPILPKVPGSRMRGDVIQIAWPVAVALEYENFVGFAMPAIEEQFTAELEFVMQDKQARAHNLSSDLGSRLILAHNLAAVVQGIHAQGHAVVDMKPVNMKFYKHELYMAVLDCDGFSINGFPAPQVTADYRAPEFFNKLIHQPEAQDRFALAVIIFRLLNFGIHPYQGIPQSSSVPNEIEERIRDGLFAYGIRPHPQLMPVPASSHESLPDELRQMFDQAFGKVTSLRPSAQEWVPALNRYATEPGKILEPCGEGHLRFPGKPCGNCLRDGVLKNARRGIAGHSTPARSPVSTLSGQTIPLHVPKQTGALWMWIGFAMMCAFLFYRLHSPTPQKNEVVAVTSPTQQAIAVPVVKQAYFGLMLAVDMDDGIVLVDVVDPDGPAEKAGLKAGDQIVTLDGQEINSRDDLNAAMSRPHPEKGFRMEIRRANRQASGELRPNMIDPAEWARRMSALQSATPVVAVFSSPNQPASDLLLPNSIPPEPAYIEANPRDAE
jgi:hypothetical protein